MVESVGGLRHVRRALAFVTDKTGWWSLRGRWRAWRRTCVDGGTARALREVGLEVRDISDLDRLSGDPGWSVKDAASQGAWRILHIPQQRGSMLRRCRNTRLSRSTWWVVNLYAFEKTANKPGVAFSDVIENIDIGGRRWCARLQRTLRMFTIVTSVADYAAIAEEMARTAALWARRRAGGWRRRRSR